MLQLSPPYKNFEITFIEQLRVLSPHSFFTLPRGFLCLVVSSQHFDQWNLLIPQFSHFSVQDLYRLFFVFKSELSSSVSEETTYDESDLYLLSIETRKTLWIFSNYGVKANRYATGPTFSITSYIPMNLGLNLPFFPNLMTFFQGDTFKNTFSPISYRMSFLFELA